MHTRPDFGKDDFESLPKELQEQILYKYRIITNQHVYRARGKWSIIFVCLLLTSDNKTIHDIAYLDDLVDLAKLVKSKFNINYSIRNIRFGATEICKCVGKDRLRSKRVQRLIEQGKIDPRTGAPPGYIPKVIKYYTMCNFNDRRAILTNEYRLKCIINGTRIYQIIGHFPVKTRWSKARTAETIVLNGQPDQNKWWILVPSRVQRLVLKWTATPLHSANLHDNMLVKVVKLNI